MLLPDSTSGSRFITHKFHVILTCQKFMTICVFYGTCITIKCYSSCTIYLCLRLAYIFLSHRIHSNPQTLIKLLHFCSSFLNHDDVVTTSCLFWVWLAEESESRWWRHRLIIYAGQRSPNQMEAEHVRWRHVNAMWHELCQSLRIRSLLVVFTENRRFSVL